MQSPPFIRKMPERSGRAFSSAVNDEAEEIANKEKNILGIRLVSSGCV